MSGDSDSNRNVVVKKVKPYPIKIFLEDQTGQRLGFTALELNLKGMIIDTGEELLTAGQKFLVNFDLPSIKYRVQEYITVIKTYDQMVESKGESEHQRRRLAEIQFSSLSDLGRRKIVTFLVAIKAPGFK